MYEHFCGYALRNGLELEIRITIFVENYFDGLSTAHVVERLNSVLT